MSTGEAIAIRGLRGNSIALMATAHVAALLGYVFWLLCARWFSAGVIGISNTVISAMTLVAILAVAGFIPMLTRLLPGASGEERSGLCSTAFVVTVFVSGLTGAGAAFLMPERVGVAVGTVWTAVFASTGAMGTALMLVSNAALLGVRRAELSLLGTAVGSIARLIAVAAILMLGLVAADADASAIHTILGVWVASLWISSVLSIGLLARATPGFRFLPGALWFSRLRCSAAWDHIAMVALRAPALALPIIAAVHLPPAEVGYLVVVVMIASAFLAVPGAVSSALLADCADDPGRLRAQSRHAARLMAILLVVPVLIAAVLAREVLSLFGAGYAHYSVLLILLLISAFPDALINLALTALRVQSRLRAVAVVTAAGAVITIGGTWVLIPRMGAFGAAAALLTSQAIIATILALMVFGAAGHDGYAGHGGARTRRAWVGWR